MAPKVKDQVAANWRQLTFFHLSTIQRRQRNQIVKLKDKDGIWRTEPREITDIIKDHFKELYKRSPAKNFEDVISLIDPAVTTECNKNRVKELSREEVRKLVFEMGALKAHGSDGFPGLFYQNS